MRLISSRLAHRPHDPRQLVRAGGESADGLLDRASAHCLTDWRGVIVKVVTVGSAVGLPGASLPVELSHLTVAHVSIAAPLALFLCFVQYAC